MTATQPIQQTRPSRAGARRQCRNNVLVGLAGLLTFVAGYLVAEPVRDLENLDAVALAAGCQLLSALGLLAFVLAIRPVWGLRPAPTALWGHRAGLAAAAALAGSGMLSLLPVTFATGLPAEHAARLHAIASVAGGPAYLACLGVFVFLTALWMPARRREEH